MHFELELRVNSLFLSASHHRRLDLAADIGLDRMVFGQDYKIARFPHNFSLWLWPASGAPQHDYLLFIFEGPKGRYGPREAWAHMGWVGHPAH